MKNNKYSNAFINTVMLYILTAAKTIFPLIILPFLTRVLSVETYGMVSYVKSLVGYEQIIIDFGFMLSAVKDIVEAKNDENKISYIIGDTVVSKSIIAVISYILFIFISLKTNILQGNVIFALLSLTVPLLSCFLMDFLFRGIEKMHLITIIFVFMKTISTVMTILLIKNDNDVLLIPIFDIVSSILAIGLTWVIIKKLGFKFKFTNIKNCLQKLKTSFKYFTNSIASTAFGALNTIVIGAYMSDAQQIAFWSVSMQIVGAVQNLYAPISSGIYPYMIKYRDLNLIKKIMIIFMPLILLGVGICYKMTPFVLSIVAGEEYIAAANVFKCLLPVLVMSFPVAIFGWSALGAINRVKETTLSTTYGAIFQITGLFILILTNHFSLIYVALIRNLSEFTMLLSRVIYLYKYRNEFNVRKED